MIVEKKQREASVGEYSTFQRRDRKSKDPMSDHVSSEKLKKSLDKLALKLKVLYGKK